MMLETKVLDNYGYVRLRNISGPTRRPEAMFDADDVDPANSARFSFDASDKKDRAREEDLKLSRYLMKNLHTTPFEMIEVWLEMQMPISVARQFVRHRTVSINEVSARYVLLPDQYYIPSPEVVGLQSASNKQGRDLVAVADLPEKARQGIMEYIKDLEEYCAKRYGLYSKHADAGIPKELARMFLTVNIYTKWLWKQNLHNLMHFMALRKHSHAQYEARVYAQAVYDHLQVVLPESMKLFDEFRSKEE